MLRVGCNRKFENYINLAHFDAIIHEGFVNVWVRKTGFEVSALVAVLLSSALCITATGDEFDGGGNTLKRLNFPSLTCSVTYHSVVKTSSNT